MKIKLNPNDLSYGMYISELDRPWVESPFIFQGFILRTAEELEQVQQLCKYVYVDIEKTPVEVYHRLKKLNGKHKKPIDFSETNTFNINEDDQLIQANFKQQVVKAKKVRDATRQYIDKALEDARFGASIDTEQAKTIVSELVDNVVSAPDASIWLTHLKKRDEYTAIHSVNVCILSIAFGRALGLSKQELNVLGLGALLHDLGKMRVPLEVLNKPDKLTNDEYMIMRAHPEEGYKLLKDDKDVPPESLAIVLGHHERLNGQGYPSGHDGTEIPYLTRIVSIVDVYDAITSDRVYHDGTTPHQALKDMYNWMPDNFDRNLMELFIKNIGIYPIGSILEFKSGHVGIVVKINEKNKLKPVVMLILSRNKEPYTRRKMINLANPMWSRKQESIEILRIVEAKEYGIDVNAILLEESSTAQ